MHAITQTKEEFIHFLKYMRGKRFTENETIVSINPGVVAIPVGMEVL